MKRLEKSKLDEEAEERSKNKRRKKTGEEDETAAATEDDQENGEGTYRSGADQLADEEEAVEFQWENEIGCCPSNQRKPRDQGQAPGTNDGTESTNPTTNQG